MPLEVAPWGDAFGMCTDKFIVAWLVNISGPKVRRQARGSFRTGRQVSLRAGPDLGTVGFKATAYSSARNFRGPGPNVLGGELHSRECGAESPDQSRFGSEKRHAAFILGGLLQDVVQSLQQCIQVRLSRPVTVGIAIIPLPQMSSVPRCKGTPNPIQAQT